MSSHSQSINPKSKISQKLATGQVGRSARGPSLSILTERLLTAEHKEKDWSLLIGYKQLSGRETQSDFCFLTRKCLAMTKFITPKMIECGWLIIEKSMPELALSKNSSFRRKLLSRSWFVLKEFHL